MKNKKQCKHKRTFAYKTSNLFIEKCKDCKQVIKSEKVMKVIAPTTTSTGMD